MLKASVIGNLGTDPETVVIPLTQGKVALVSRVDAHLAEFNWCAVHHKNGWYAARAVGPRGKQRLVYMHRAILGTEMRQRVDHRDHDGLNNRRSNLRRATASQNNSNSYRPKNRSGFRGVVPMGNRWRAQIRKNHERIYLGFYGTPEEAARAYDTAARALHGEFATLNFSEEAA